jgi:signal transduction histidine kinase
MRDQTLAFGRMDAEEMQSMEKEILSLNRDLNNLTRELHKKNVQLKKLNEEKNRFLGMAAHDLRKPIGLILAYAEFLIEETDGLLSDEHMEFLDTIYKRCHLMKGLVDDFLDISAIEAGKLELDLQWVNILTVLEQSLALNHLQAEKKGVNLEVQTEEKIPALFIDAPKIEQVITNLISNAIEHSEPEAEILVDLAFDQKNIVFSVRDSGPGIASHEMDRLFQPFAKASSKKSGGAKSTGLGLMISRKIIEAHNGDIWVDSQLGSGTLISFYLPHHMDKS